MASVSTPPPRPPAPNLTRACVRCALHRRPGVLARVFLGAHPNECLAEAVRGYTLDPVSGLARLDPPADCSTARGAHGLCGPEGKHFAHSREREGW